MTLPQVSFNSDRRIKYLVFFIAVILISGVSVLGATKASVYEPHLFKDIGWYGELGLALLIGIMMIFPEKVVPVKNEVYAFSIVASMIVSFVALFVISQIEPSLVSNRSYFYIIGTGIVFFQIICLCFIVKQTIISGRTLIKEPKNALVEIRALALMATGLFAVTMLFLTLPLVVIVFLVTFF